MHITTTQELEKFCDQLSNAEFITIDTEFFRETTYYPKLCIIQVASKDRAVIIDALNKKLDLTVLNSILQNDKIVKVFHSAKQDLEILYHLYRQLPQNIFDTQIAASFCGYGAVASYESLVLEIANQHIDKSYCVSDWAQRPLHDKQIEYALADVTYLRDIYTFLSAKLKENNRYEWAMEDIVNLNAVENFIIDPNQAWRKVKNTRGMKVNGLFKKLAAWREIKAQEYNLPRNHYLHENHLLRLMEIMPMSLAEFRAIPHFRKIDDMIATDLTGIIKDALRCNLEDDLQHYPSPLHPKFNKLIDSLKNLLENTAQQHNIPSRLIATNAELKSICNTDQLVKPLLGWRNEVFGKEALRQKLAIIG